MFSFNAEKGPKVSVLVPVYNLENCIGGCINSIINQTYRNIEIIIVDDGSTDRSRVICEEIAEQNPQIVLFFHQENAGVASARNRAIEHASGDYIAFVDGDDGITRNYIERLLLAATEGNADIVTCKYIDAFSTEERDRIAATMSDASAEVKTFSAQETLQLLLKQRIAPSSCERLFSRKVIGEVRFWTGKRYNEDKYFMFQVLFNATKTVFTDEKMYICLNRTESVSRNKNGYNNDLIEIAERIKEDVKHGNHDELLELAEYNYLLTLLYSAKLLFRKEVADTERKRYLEQIRSKLKQIPKNAIKQMTFRRRVERLALLNSTPAFRSLVRLFDLTRRKQ